MLTGCGSKMENIKIYSDSKYSSIAANCGSGMANKKLEGIIIEKLQKNGVKFGDDLRIDCSDLSFDEGNRFARWMLPGAGSAKASVNIKIPDKSSKMIATFDASATMGMGAFGGDADGVFEYLADEIVKQTINNFYTK